MEKTKKNNKTTKEKKSTIKRIIEFVFSEDINIVNTVYVFVLVASIITLSFVAFTSSFMLTFCAGANGMLLCCLINETRDLIDEYRWYFDIDENKKGEQQ